MLATIRVCTYVAANIHKRENIQIIKCLIFIGVLIAALVCQHQKLKNVSTTQR